MDIRQGFLSIFPTNKPILGMLHLKGDTPTEKLERAVLEAQQMTENGVDAVIVENYFSKPEEVIPILEYFYSNNVNFTYGLNVLHHDEMAFELAEKYKAAFIQLDSVAGHLPVDQDLLFGQQLNQWRKDYSGYVLGGVRFKYQPYLSGRSLEEDLAIGKSRCDGIVVTGVGTGMNTSLEKIKEFRHLLGDFPLVVGAGLTDQSCRQQLDCADAAIVGSYFKDDHIDTGNVNPSYVATFMQAVKACR